MPQRSDNHKPRLTIGMAIVLGFALGVARGAAFGDITQGVIYDLLAGTVVVAIAEGLGRRMIVSGERRSSVAADRPQTGPSGP
jgi:hypothetical protein